MEGGLQTRNMAKVSDAAAHDEKTLPEVYHEVDGGNWIGMKAWLSSVSTGLH